jgi:hypothetical protein
VNATERELDRLLGLITERLDPEHQRAVGERYRAALSWETVDRPPLVIQGAFGSALSLPEPWADFHYYPYGETFENPAAMLQDILLERVVPGLILRDDNPLAVRDNHGTVLVASALAGRWRRYGDDYPWIEPLGSTDAVREVADGAGARLDPDAGLLPAVIETLQCYRDALARHRGCLEEIPISLPDLQGPMDTAEQSWGSGIHLAFYDDPELVDRLLGRIVEVTAAVWDLLRPYTSANRLEPLAHAQHGYQVPGRLLVRNDSAVLLSARTYAGAIRPHDAALLAGVGGGSIHFCGNGAHLVEEMLAIPDLLGLDFGQPEQMDVGAIYGLCRERRVALTHLMPAREELVSGMARSRFPTGVVFVYKPESVEDALEVVGAYKEQDGGRSRTEVHGAEVDRRARR